MRLLVLVFMLIQSVFCFSQQKSVCEIVPLHIGKYPLIVSKYENGSMGELLILNKDSNYIVVGNYGIKIVIDEEVKHDFKYTSIPRSGIEYQMFDEKYNTDINVYIMYVKDENKDKYFGMFVRYDENLELVFTYKAGTQIE